MAKMFSFAPSRVSRWDNVEQGSLSLSTALRLHKTDSLPRVIEAGMIAVPAIRVLRGVYGSDEKAAKALVFRCVRQRFQRGFWAVSRFWRYRVLMRSQERDLNEFLAEGGGE